MSPATVRSILDLMSQRNVVDHMRSLRHSAYPRSQETVKKRKLPKKKNGKKKRGSDIRALLFIQFQLLQLIARI